MNYPTIQPADFRAIGYERRDDSAQPRVLVVGVLSHDQKVHFHVAGEDHLRVAHLDAAAKDTSLVAGMDPVLALRVGTEWGRMHLRRQRQAGIRPDVQQVEA